METGTNGPVMGRNQEEGDRAHKYRESTGIEPREWNLEKRRDKDE